MIMPFILPNTLTFRLTLRYAITFIVLLTIAFICSYFLIETNLKHEIEEDLSEDMEEYQLIFNEGGIDSVINEIKRDVKTVDSDDEFVQVFNSHGQQVFSSDISIWPGLKNNREFFKEKILAYRGLTPVIETIEIPGREFETKIVFNKVGDDAVLMIGESMEQIVDVMELILIIFSVILLTVIPFASLISYMMVRHSVGGIRKVSQAAVEIKNGNLDTRVTVGDQYDEINNLAETFNSMSARIQKLMTEMREMIENIAHDLRSPLGRIRMISEMALSANGNVDSYKNAAAETIEECDQLIQLINISLDVAEAEAGVNNNNNEDINLSKIMEDACELYEPVAEDKHIDLTVQSDPDCKMHGNKQNIQRMIANVIDNALKYTPENGSVSAVVKRQVNVNQITVSDTGIGIPVAEQSRVFDRFYRCDQSRSHDGSGLGLSFARAVAHAHGGQITLMSEPGIKTIITISLPATT